MQTSLTIVGLLNDTGSPSPVDAFVHNLAKMRDEGFRRVWMAQLPYDPDLTTLLAVALREVDTIEVVVGEPGAYAWVNRRPSRASRSITGASACQRRPRVQRYEYSLVDERGQPQPLHRELRR